jgi:hypothetical protein
MLRFTTLFFAFWASFAAQGFAQSGAGPDFRSTWVLEVSAQICMVNQRDVCILKSATYALNNAELLQHMHENYPEKVNWFQERFEQSSYTATQRGRSIFRRILAENAIETLETYYSGYMAKNDTSITPDSVNSRSAIFHSIRAQSCVEQKDDVCVIESLREVRDAMDSGKWAEIVARFQLEEPEATQAQEALLQRFWAKL